METKRKDLGQLSDIGAVNALFAVKGLSLIDVGCGAGNIARDLRDLGAMVLGVEPDPIQAEKNRSAPPSPRVTFIEARAEELPVETESVDGVFLFRSLHHVPIDKMGAALAEAARVLKRKTGFLFVVEPAMTGTHFPVMRPFHDETLVRTEAQAVLARTATRLFGVEEQFSYIQYPRYENFEALVMRVTGNSFNDIRRENVETNEVQKLFEIGRTSDGFYTFEQPMLLNIYRGII